MSSTSSTHLEFVFAHGWAMGDWFWEPLQRQLECRSVQNWSTPYFHDPDMSLPSGALPADPGTLPKSPWVGIGHSLGFRKLLDVDLSCCRALISLGGFLSFCNENTDTELAVRKMLRGIGRERSSVIRAFYRNCGLTCAVPESPNFAVMERDLQLLLPENGLEMGPVDQWKGVPVLALAGARDQIVALETARTQFAKLDVHPEATHGLGWDHSHWCAERIANWLESI